MAAIRNFVNDLEKNLGYEDFSFEKIFKSEVIERDNALRRASNYDPPTGKCKPSGWYCYEVKE